MSSGVYLHYLSNRYISAGAMKWGRMNDDNHRNVNPNNYATLSNALEEARAKLFELKGSTLSGQDEGLKNGSYHDLEDFLSDLQYRVPGVEAKSSMLSDGKLEDYRKKIADQLLMYTALNGAFYMDYSNMDGTQSLTHLKAKQFDYIAQKERIYLDSLDVFKTRIETILKSVDATVQITAGGKTGNYHGIKPKTGSYADLRAQIDELKTSIDTFRKDIESRAITTARSEKGYVNKSDLTEDEAGKLSGLLKSYYKLVNTFSLGEAKQWGDIAEMYYGIALAVFQNYGRVSLNKILNEFDFAHSDFVLGSKNGQHSATSNGVSLTGKQLTDGVSLGIQINTSGSKLLSADKRVTKSSAAKSKDVKISQSFNEEEIDDGKRKTESAKITYDKNGLVKISISASASTADLTVSTSGASRKKLGISVKNYTSTSMGGSYGLHVLSSARFGQILGLFNSSFISHALTAYSDLHKTFPSNGSDGKVDNSKTVSATSKREINKYITAAAVMRGLAGIRSAQVRSRSNSGKAGLLIVNDPLKQKVHVLSSEKIIDFLLQEANLKDMSKYAKITGLPKDKRFANAWEGDKKKVKPDYDYGGLRAARAIIWASSLNVGAQLKLKNIVGAQGFIC